MENAGYLRANQSLHESLVHMVHRGETGLKEVPALLLKIIQEDAWRERYVPQLEKVVTFEKFIDYVTTPPLAGMNVTTTILRAICRDHPEARSALEEALTDKPGNRQGRNQYTSGIVVNHYNSKKRDNAGQRIVTLRRHHPELHEKVVKGEMTIHQAAIQAGLYPKRLSVNAQNPESGAMSILRNCGVEYAQAFIEALAREIASQ